MSDLHQLLNDQSQPSNSTLSFLLSAGEAGLTFQREIFQYLNVRDARNLRLTSKRLDHIVRGQTLWELRDSHGNPFFARDSPPNPNAAAAFPTHNSTLRWLGAGCHGVSFPGRIPCTAGPLTNVQVRNCTRVPSPPLNSNCPRALPCCEEVCAGCVRSAAVHFRAVDARAIAIAHRTRLCGRCQLSEARRHPLGYEECDCAALLNRGWMCWACRHETRKQIGDKRVARELALVNLRRDRRGGKVLDDRRRRRERSVCPGCACFFVDRDPRVPHVVFCMSCKGVVVKPTLGTNFRPTKLMPAQPTRRSARIAAKYAAMPPLDFAPL